MHIHAEKQQNITNKALKCYILFSSVTEMQLIVLDNSDIIIIKESMEVDNMSSIFDVAKYILEKKGELTTMKLQKLCYYSQAWSLAWYEEPIFNEEFEAWANGPVCPQLFNLHRGLFSINYREIPDKYGADNLSSTQIDIINRVLDFYGDRDSHWLSELTHMERPWKAAREKANALPGDYCNEIISKEEMLDYYSGLS